MTVRNEAASVNPSAMALADAARLLSKVGGRSITEAMLQDDVAAGAPTNADGTLNLVHFAAWLVKEINRTAGREVTPNREFGGFGCAGRFRTIFPTFGRLQRARPGAHTDC